MLVLRPFRIEIIESDIPFPAPEKRDNRGLPSFHPRKIIVIGECPLLSPEGISLFVPFPVPCLPKNFFPGSPETIDSFFHPLLACLMTAWQLPDNCLTTSCQVSDNCLRIAWQLPDKCQMVAWQQSDDCLRTAWQLPNNCWITAW